MSCGSVTVTGLEVPGRERSGPQKSQPEPSLVKMALAVKRPANEPFTGLFSGPLTAQFYFFVSNWAANEPLPIFKIPFNLHFPVNCGQDPIAPLPRRQMCKTFVV